MHSLYEIVNATVNSDSMETARRILFGFDEFSANIDEYYKRIVSSFVRKKDIIIKQENGKLIFDLENVNDLWSMLFIAEYIKIEIEKIELQINAQINELNNKHEILLNRAREEKINLDKERKRIVQQKKKLEKKVEDVLKCKSGFFDLETFSYSIELEQNINIKQELLKKIKESIKSIHILRNVIEHGDSQNKNGIVIDNYGIKISIPYTYLDGFNKGKIIARDEDRIIVEKTNEAIYPILEEFGYDIKKIESFFYNVEPSQLSFLLKICDNKTENLYRLPLNIFYKSNNINRIITTLLKVNNSNILQDEDYELLNSIKFEINNTFTNNLIILLYSNEDLKLDSKELVILSEVLTKFDLKIFNGKEDVQNAIPIINNYIKLKNKFSNELRLIKFGELPYKIFEMPYEKSSMYLQNIIILKKIINTAEKNLERKLGLNFNLNLFLNDDNLLPYLSDIIDIITNIDKYAPEKNPFLYLSQLLFDISYGQTLRMSARYPYKFRSMEEEEKKRIDQVINRYKNNCDINRDLRMDDLIDYKHELKSKSNTNREKIISIIKELRNKNQSFTDYLKAKSVNDSEWLLISDIRLYEEELYYLIDKTNNYNISLDLILKLKKNINNNNLQDDGIIYDRNQSELYSRKIKTNFKRNIDKLLSKYTPEDMLKFPSEILYSDDIVFDSLFVNYNENLCKSIFGIENPKIIGALLYANSVFSLYQKEDLKMLDIDFDKIIHNCFNDTYKYRHNITDLTITQESYLSQFLLDGDEQRDYQSIKSNIMNKFRNSFAHFRFKPVRDEKGNIVPDKIYLYDKYEEVATNNFNIIIDLKDLVELTRQIEIGLSKKKENPIDDKKDNRYKAR